VINGRKIRKLPSDRRRAFWNISLLGLLVVGTSGCISSGGDKLPDWMLPGVRVGSDRLEKKLFLSLRNVGPVTDIQRGELRSPGKVELGVAGNYGAGFFDDSAKPVASVNFPVQEPESAKLSSEIVSQSHSSGLLFFRHAFTYGSLVDSIGKEIWRTTYSPNASTFGYVGPNGTPEFFFGNGGSIEARNVSGAVIWQTSGVGWSDRCDLLDSSDVERRLIVESGGTLVTLSLSGDILSKKKPAGEVEEVFSDFSVLNWPPVCQADCLLVSGNDRFFLLSSDGQSVVTSLAPAIGTMDARGLAVRLFENGPPVLAVVGLVAYKGGKWVGLTAVHGVLYIFDAHGELVYYEVLSEPVEALGMLPSADGKTDTLLIGGENKVWQYSAPQGNTAHSPKPSN
jgi:hypothetical protein